jgi:SnoaL-like domain
MTPLPTEVVATFFKLLRAGNTEQALRCWSPDGVWHVTGKSTRAGDYSLSEYLAMCAQWYVDYPRYVAEFGALDGMGELAFFPLRSQHGEAPGETEGMMLYRVIDGLITEGWAIPANHGDRYTF